MTAAVLVVAMVAGLAAFGAWLVGRLGEIDRRVYAELRAQQDQSARTARPGGAR